MILIPIKNLWYIFIKLKLIYKIKYILVINLFKFRNLL